MSTVLTTSRSFANDGSPTAACADLLSENVTLPTRASPMLSDVRAVEVAATIVRAAYSAQAGLPSSSRVRIVTAVTWPTVSKRSISSSGRSRRPESPPTCTVLPLRWCTAGVRSGLLWGEGVESRQSAHV